MGRQGQGRQQRRRAQRRQTERSQQPRAQQARGQQKSSSLPYIAGGVIILAVIAALGYAVVRGNQKPTATPTPQALAAAIDGVQCNSTEMLVYHIHQHLAMFDNGKSVTLPSSIGMPGGEQNAACYYWIHVHAAYPGILHVESPIQKTFTLGQFFDVWKATKDDAIPSSDAYVLKLQQAAAQGNVTVFVGSKRWTRGYRSVPLLSHESITVEIGKPIVPPVIFTNWNGL